MPHFEKDDGGKNNGEWHINFNEGVSRWNVRDGAVYYLFQ